MNREPQWWEYHLTPQGWTEGSRKAGGANVIVDPPVDRVVTMEWRANPESANGGEWAETWKSIDEERLSDLRKQFGDKPERQ
jgi:hypothetical protein